MNGHCNKVCHGENVEREIETHISTIETTSSGLATAARSVIFSASFTLKEININSYNHNHNHNHN